ncbi:CGNR zinc finger domain-containing protein [Streptomyces sp. NPDC047085]|uniref:CGNR zinc finger domain-containing protein n=1 Tax=Streptomyces sp. NPDC047085 TaxID=3155140 RepID=UPI003407EC0B
MMSWTATVRYDLEPAPGGLALVQDLLNTLSAGRPREADLLENAEDARAWLDQALRSWSDATHRPAPAIDLTAEDAQGLRDFRHDLNRLVGTQTPDASSEPGPVASLMTLPTALRLDEQGHIHAEPRGTGWRQVASLALIEAYQAQCTDTLRRLKTCRNPRCATAFYDRSRNNSGVWHDVRVCGNAANLRNYRARKRAGAGADQA